MYKKKGLPEAGDIVLCTVKKILPHSVFVSLDEYTDLEGMIHISEISPGRIRTIFDFVKEGKKIVCKILKIDEEKKHIDLSLRRVTTISKITKLKEMKQEEKAERLLKIVGEKLNKPLTEMYKELGYKAIDRYGSLNQFFQNALEDKPLEIEIPKKTSEIIKELVKEKIRQQELKVTGKLIITDFSPEGIDHIKKSLSLEAKNIKIRYISAPQYRIEVTSTNYKTAEDIMKKTVNDIINTITKLGGKGEFQHG